MDVYDGPNEPFQMVERDDLDARLKPVRRQRWIRELNRMQMDYSVMDAWNAGATARDIAAASGLREAEITDTITYCTNRPAPDVAGRLGRRPLEVAYRYALGEISKDEMIEDLGTWPYLPVADNTNIDPPIMTPGSIEDIEDASSWDLITTEELDELNRRMDRWRVSTDGQ